MSGAQMTSLGKYAIRGVLGKGAMGTVYDGWDPVIDRRVAIKTVRVPDAQDEEAAEGLARFKREAQAAGRLTHPNIVGVFDYGETEDLAYIVMEFVEGRSLKDVMGANERMTTASIIALMEDILAGLTFSHGRGVVHRDIKPANIMITLDDRAKIADFGIARIEASSMTQAGTVLGTPAYMSPEQFMGQVVDRRTDIYSCGVLLYQLLTGDRPFDGSMTAIMHKVLTTVPPRPSELVVTAPASLDAVVAKAMARRPEDRYDTASEFAQALRAPSAAEAAFASDETIVAAPRPAGPRPTPAAPVVPQVEPVQSGSKLPVFAGGAVAVLAAAAAIVWFVLPSHDTVAPASQQASVAQPPAAAPETVAPVQPPPAGSPPISLQQALAQPPAVQPAPAPPTNLLPALVPRPLDQSTSSSQASNPPAATAPGASSPTPMAKPVQTPSAAVTRAPASTPSPSPFVTAPAPSFAPPPSQTQQVTNTPAPSPVTPTSPPRPVQPPTASVAPPAVPPPSPSPFVAVPPPSSAQPPTSSQTASNSPVAPPAASVPLPSSAAAPAPGQQASVSIPPPASPFTATGSAPLPSSAPSQFASVGSMPEPPRSNPVQSPPAAPVRSAAVIEAALASSLPAVKCSLARATAAADGTVTVTGVAGEGQPADALRKIVAASDPAGINWQAQSFDGPYCPALDVLRPVVDTGRDRGGMELAQAGGPVSLTDNDVIALKLTMPGFGGYLHVEYLQHDATVAPQVPGPGYPSQTYAAHAQIDLGTPRQDFGGWHVGPPFGTDMIVAVASTAPLFARPLPDSQPLAAYLNSLQAAIEALRRRGGSVAATAVVLDTRPAR